MLKLKSHEARAGPESFPNSTCPRSESRLLRPENHYGPKRILQRRTIEKPTRTPQGWGESRQDPWPILAANSGKAELLEKKLPLCIQSRRPTQPALIWWIQSEPLVEFLPPGYAVRLSSTSGEINSCRNVAGISSLKCWNETLKS